MKTGGTLSIWLFIGFCLFVNGVLILGTGIYELSHPPETTTVLSNLHATIWWGAILTILGAVYCVAYRPGKSQ